MKNFIMVNQFFGQCDFEKNGFVGRILCLKILERGGLLGRTIIGCGQTLILSARPLFGGFKAAYVAVMAGGG